ncbi:MAG: P1 family peptidase [Chloroflexi bacterium]|nr:P1 family peptidase [Chloroflexota bacterium]MYD48403.1 P1 family peptidase [Chloroflexota bacterium]
MAANNTITAVPGITAGHWTDANAATGCTVILCGDTATGGVAIRGGSPGTHETDLLNPIRRVDRVHAVLLAGGSAFGLATTAGVLCWLEERGVGFETPHGPVPIVPAAILYDLGVGRADLRPDANAGYAACDAASDAPLPSGSVGAGTGASVAKAFGSGGAVKGGIGSACCTLPNGISVAATVAVNAWGGIYDPHDGSLVAGPRRHDGSMADPIAAILNGEYPPDAAAMTNTTIGVVATDAALDKMQANFVASTAHDGLALAIRPCHTPGDGDTLFCVATGHNPTPSNLTAITAAATHVAGLAVLDAIQSATGLAGIPSVNELNHGIAG